MTIPDLYRIAEELYRVNLANQVRLSESVYARHKLPPAAPVLISNLDALLADLQKRSFLMGVAAALWLKTDGTDQDPDFMALPEIQEATGSVQ